MTAGAGTEVDTLVRTNGTQVGSALIDTGPASGHPEPAGALWARPDPPDQLDLPELSAPLDPRDPPDLLARSDLPAPLDLLDPRDPPAPLDPSAPLDLSELSAPLDP